MVPITSDGRSRTLLPSFHGSNMTLFGSAASQSRNKASAFFVAANVDGRKLGAPNHGYHADIRLRVALFGFSATRAPGAASGPRSAT